MRVRTYRDVYQLLTAKGYSVAARITNSGKPLVTLRNEKFDQNKNILFVSRDYRGLDNKNEEVTLIPCKAPGVEIVSNMMRLYDIGKCDILGIYDVLDWFQSGAVYKKSPTNLSNRIEINVLTPAEKVKFLRNFFDTLGKFVKARGYTGVVFCGGYTYDATTGDFVSDWTKWGRVWNEFGVPCTLTVPLNYIALDRDNEEATNMASLVGFLRDHLEGVLHGDNFYTLDCTNVETQFVKTIEEFDEFMRVLVNTKLSCWDTETTGLSRLGEDLLLIQVAISEKIAYVIPYKHKQSPFSESELEYIASKLKHYFEYDSAGSIHIYHNAKYDLNQFYHVTRWRYYAAKIYDTMAGEYALKETRKNLKPLLGVRPFSLDFLAANYGDSEIYKQGNVGKQDRTNLAEKDLNDIAEYGVKDVIIPYQLYHFQIDAAKRKKDHNFLNVVLHVIGDIIYCTTILEQNGEKLDKEYLISLLGTFSDTSFGKKLKNVERDLYQTEQVKIANDIICENAGYKPASGHGLFGQTKWLFNIGKPEHKKILFVDVMGLEPDKTKTGKDSIGKAFKEKYKSDPIVAMFDRLEKMKKAYSTFIEAHFERFKTDKDLKVDGRLRSDYNFTSVLTGRISANNPNLQQIPSRGEFSKIIKRQFVAEPGNFFLKADYSAHEVRNWGNVSGDPNVCAAFDIGKQLRKKLRYYFTNDYQILDKFEKFKVDTGWEVPKGQHPITYNEKAELISNIQDARFKKFCEIMFELENRGDVHKLNYEFFCGVPAAEVTPVQRQSAKGLVFGTIYGRGPHSIATEINTSPEEAENLQRLMFDKFNRGSEWLIGCKQNGAKTLEVHSPIGRVRHCDSYANGSPSIISATDRQGPNSCIQGFSSDVGFSSGKILQDICWKWLWSRGIDFQFKYCNVVHDSTETEVRLRDLPLALYLIEHSYTTLVHRKLKKLYNMDLVCGYEVEADFGTSMCHMETFKNFLNFVPLVNQCLDWTKKEMPNWTCDQRDIETCFHNFEVLSKIRKHELKKTFGCKVDTYMYLNRDNITTVGLQF